MSIIRKGGTGPNLPDSSKSDLSSFLAAFPVEHKDWPAVLAGLKTTIPGEIKPWSKQSERISPWN